MLSSRCFRLIYKQVSNQLPLLSTTKNTSFYNNYISIYKNYQILSKPIFQLATGKPNSDAYDGEADEEINKPGSTNESDNNERMNIQKKKALSSRRILKNTYKSILNRVVDTCLKYLRASRKTQSKVRPESRFYYVKEILDVMGLDEKQEFIKYLESRKEFFEALTKAKTKVSNEETVKKQALSKKSTQLFLEEPNNGPILLQLIVEFLRKENPDFKWFINLEEDEKNIGEITKKKIRESDRKRLFLLTEHLDLTRKRFRKLDKIINRED